MNKTAIEKATIIGKNSLQLIFLNKHKIDKTKLTVLDKNNEEIKITEIEQNDTKVLIKIEDIIESNLPYTIHYKKIIKEFIIDFTYIDSLYFYKGDDLGSTINWDSSVTLKLWSPMVKDVKVILYDKNNQDTVIKDNISMIKDSNGIWIYHLNETNTKVKDLKGYYYNYKIDAKGDGNFRLTLDPYAKSMAAFDNKKYYIGKAAIINPTEIGPKLEYAKIPNFSKREDAIIWEIHVRDFTVDPSIENSLNSRFGTFKAFIDRLPYIKDLGVTHIQLLPVMSYFLINELKSSEREMNWSSKGNNYNWGYDPHSYFSLSGAYSENPENPELRIGELKELISEIHKQEMGIILDVVYNHTSSVHIFEDLAPNYYHFMDKEGQSKTSFGGGRLGTTHYMARKILVDSILYFTKEFKVDGFRFDMMGDHDAESIQIAFDEAKKINPNIIMIGEGWRTYVGDYGDSRTPADQDWMEFTESVGVFSDEFRNELKSGFQSEGEPRFITGGKRKVGIIFDNIKAQPHNFVADQAGDVVPYIEAHDNLTLHDVIAQSIKKDPDIYEEEIHRRIRIGNALLLTSQGTAFLHGGQEYGRTKQWRDEKNPPLWKETYMTDKEENPFKFPYFIHDSYDSTDIINMFDWEKAVNCEKFPITTLTRAYTKGLIELRKSTDAFRLGSKEIIDKNVTLLYPKRDKKDVIIAYSVKSTQGEEYFIFVNGDESQREFPINENLLEAIVLVDEKEAGVKPIISPKGLKIMADRVIVEALTVVILKKI